MKNKKNIVIILLSIVLVALLGTIGYFKFFKGDKKVVVETETLIPDIRLDDNAMPIFIDGSLVKVKIESKNDAYDALNSIKKYYGVKDVKNEFTLLKENIVNENFKTYKFQQKYKGLDVDGYQLVISANKDNVVTDVVGKYFPNIDLNVSKALKEQEILDIYISTANETGIKSSDSQKVIFIKDNEPFVAYKYTIASDKNYYQLYLNANDGTLLSKSPMIYFCSEDITVTDSLGKTQTINIEKIGPEIAFHDKNRKIKIFYGKDDVIINGNDGLIDVVLSLVSLGDFATRIIPATFTQIGDSYVANDINDNNSFENYVTLMANMEQVYDFYNDNFGWKSYDGKGANIRIFTGLTQSFMPTLNGKQYYDNAAFTSKVNVFVFGNTQKNYPYGNEKFIVAHEYTHGVSQNIVNFNGSLESGPLNEAYSDIMAFAITGETEGKVDTEVFRSLSDPVKTGNSVKKYGDNYSEVKSLDELSADNDNNYSHKNSTIISHIAYLIDKNKITTDLNQLGQIYYNSMYKQPSATDFVTQAYTIMSVAKDVGIDDEKVDKIKQYYIDANILTDDISISGKVTDQDGKGAEVRITFTNKKNPAVFYLIQTEEDGTYKISNINAGEYDVLIEKGTYETVRDEITIDKTRTDCNFKVKERNVENNHIKEIVFVIDRSKSMDDNDPNDIRKQIIANLISASDTDMSMGVVTFTKTAVPLYKNKSALERMKKSLITDVFNIVNDDGRQKTSGTNGRAGINKAISMISNSNETTKYIIFLTDGQDNDNDTTIPSYNELIKTCKKRGIKIISIGLSEDVETDNLMKLATETDGEYIYADDGTDLSQLDRKLFEILN